MVTTINIISSKDHTKSTV